MTVQRAGASEILLEPLTNGGGCSGPYQCRGNLSWPADSTANHRRCRPSALLTITCRPTRRVASRNRTDTRRPLPPKKPRPPTAIQQNKGHRTAIETDRVASSPADIPSPGWTACSLDDFFWLSKREGVTTVALCRIREGCRMTVVFLRFGSRNALNDATGSHKNPASSPPGAALRARFAFAPDRRWARLTRVCPWTTSADRPPTTTS